MMNNCFCFCNNLLWMFFCSIYDKPAGFQYNAVGSKISTTPVCPMPMARAPGVNVFMPFCATETIAGSKTKMRSRLTNPARRCVRLLHNDRMIIIHFKCSNGFASAFHPNRIELRCGVGTLQHVCHLNGGDRRPGGEDGCAPHGDRDLLPPPRS